MTDLLVRPDLVDPNLVGAFSEGRGRLRPRIAGVEHPARVPVQHWREVTGWCDQQRGPPCLPASAAAVSGYLVALAGAGAKVGTMSRRLSAIRFVHQLRDQPDPTRNARVVAVREGLPPEQAAPLMPPDLFDVVDARPTTKVWRTPNRPVEPNLAGARDRALLINGFVAAMRRTELAALTVDQVAEHPHGLVITLPRSKTNQTGEPAEVVVLPQAETPSAAPSSRSSGGATSPGSARGRCCAR